MTSKQDFWKEDGCEMADAEILALGKKRADEIGLVPYYNMDGFHASDIFRWLGRGVFITGQFRDGHLWLDSNDRDHYNEKPTHQGLLIGIRTLVPETREQKLEAVVKGFMDCIGHTITGPLALVQLIDRAKELIK